MAKTPTLAAWELDLLRTIENVVRLGHIKHVTRDEIVLDDGTVSLAPGSLIVHCAASGLQYPPLVPLWGPDKIRLQTIRVGFPCFCAALAGTWKRPATMTESATDCVRPTPCPTARPAGRGCRFAEPSRRGPTALSQTSPPGRTAAP